MTRQSHIKIRKYKVYHTIHLGNQAKGRSVIIIKESINQYEESHLQRIDIQLTVVKIKSTKQKLKIGAVYSNPDIISRHNIIQEDYKTLNTLV